MTVGRCSHAWTFGHPFTWLLFVSLSVSIKCSISFTLLLHSLLLCFSASLPPSAAFCSPSSVLHLPQSTRMGMMEGSRSKKKVIPARGRIKRRIFACFFRKLKLIPPSTVQFILSCERWNPWELRLFLSSWILYKGVRFLLFAVGSSLLLYMFFFCFLFFFPSCPSSNLYDSVLLWNECSRFLFCFPFDLILRPKEYWCWTLTNTRSIELAIDV